MGTKRALWIPARAGVGRAAHSRSQCCPAIKPLAPETAACLAWKCAGNEIRETMASGMFCVVFTLEEESITHKKEVEETDRNTAMHTHTEGVG